MYLILFLMFLGLAIGFTVIPRQKNDKLIKAVSHVQAAATIVLLFGMGAWLGGNEEFWLNIRTIGTAGLLFAACCILGSILAVYVLTRLLLRRGAK